MHFKGRWNDYKDIQARFAALALFYRGPHLQPSSHDPHFPEATLTILSVDDQPSRDFQGLIRSQDIRHTEKDKVKVWLSFRPGDLYVLP